MRLNDIYGFMLYDADEADDGAEVAIFGCHLSLF